MDVNILLNILVLASSFKAKILFKYRTLCKLVKKEIDSLPENSNYAYLFRKSAHWKHMIHLSKIEEIKYNLIINDDSDHFITPVVELPEFDRILCSSTSSIVLTLSNGYFSLFELDLDSQYLKDSIALPSTSNQKTTYNHKLEWWEEGKVFFFRCEYSPVRGKLVVGKINNSKIILDPKVYECSSYICSKEKIALWQDEVLELCFIQQMLSDKTILQCTDLLKRKDYNIAEFIRKGQYHVVAHKHGMTVFLRDLVYDIQLKRDSNGKITHGGVFSKECWSLSEKFECELGSRTLIESGGDYTIHLVKENLCIFSHSKVKHYFIKLYDLEPVYKSNAPQQCSGWRWNRKMRKFGLIWDILETTIVHIDKHIKTKHNILFSKYFAIVDQ